MEMNNVWVALFIFIGIILLGGIVYSNIEGWSFLDSIYFSAVTITTLGYGDFVPQTSIGKVVTIIFSMSGIAIGLYILTMIGKNIFSIDMHRGVRIHELKSRRKFSIEKMTIGMVVSWRSGKEILQGIINEIGLNYIKLHVEKRNGQLVPKNDQKIIKITTAGRLKNT